MKWMYVRNLSLGGASLNGDILQRSFVKRSVSSFILTVVGEPKSKSWFPGGKSEAGGNPNSSSSPVRATSGAISFITGTLIAITWIVNAS